MIEYSSHSYLLNEEHLLAKDTLIDVYKTESEMFHRQMEKRIQIKHLNIILNLPL